ncbi:hypothetical protein [Microbacterium indicum]|nr:hypothetical protein [Microbacterium indicum]
MLASREEVAYVAAAEIRGILLVTADARIARAGAARCEVRVTGRA